MSRIVVVGDALLDIDLAGRVTRVSPDAPVPVVDLDSESARPGGAALASILAASDGNSVTLVTSLAADDAGQRLRDLIENRCDILTIPNTGTTAVKRRIRVGGQSLLRLDTGTAGEFGAVPDDVQGALAEAEAVLVSDYGGGLVSLPRIRQALERCVDHVPIAWDPHPRGGDPIAGVHVATPNVHEAGAFAARHHGPQNEGDGITAISGLAESLRTTWAARSVAITMGARGVLLATGEAFPFAYSVPPISTGDPCGAGDRLASSIANWLAKGASLSDAVETSVTIAAEFVARGGCTSAQSRPAETHETRGPSAADVVESVRARRGVVVATGGCFDLVHPGHLATLSAARRLGDCLIVFVNSDESVRRIKGHGRPLVPAAERALLIGAMRCVDGVVIFDDDTPSQALRRIKPDVWAKGGDYTGRNLPEAEMLEEWGGRAVILPYLAGYSTTQLVSRAFAVQNPEALWRDE